MNSLRKILSDPWRRLGALPPALILGLGTTFIAVAAVLTSFTPAYAQLTCPVDPSSNCFANLTNPCGIGCQSDNNGDMCTDVRGVTIKFYKLAGPSLNTWSKCTMPSPAKPGLSCSETATSCGTPTYYYQGGSISGGGANNCLNTCNNPLIWVSCSATNGSNNCDGGTSKPQPGQ